MKTARSVLRLLSILLLTVIGPFSLSSIYAEDTAGSEDGKKSVLSPNQQAQVDEATAKALAFIAENQNSDGSFMTSNTGQPGVTALCVLAFLAQGHLPGEGPYGERMNKGIDYVMSCQQDNGLISAVTPPPTWSDYNGAHTGLYNHTTSGLLLAEVYGMVDSERSKKISQTLDRALKFSRFRQTMKKENPLDVGAWRYLAPYYGVDGDICITSWHLMFWRSAKNAGFDIPTEWVDEGLGFVKQCYNDRLGVFYYTLHGTDTVYSRGTTGIGVLSLSLAGEHETEMAQKAGDWILAHPFTEFRQSPFGWDRFYYSTFYCSQAMYQLGGKYWVEFYPVLVRTLVSNQSRNGSWDSSIERDRIFGDVYTTAMAVLALSAENQLLPIFQR